MSTEVERPGSPIPLLILVGLAILGALWIVRVVAGLVWTVVQLGVLVLFVVLLVKVFGARRKT